jgi:hypothetical protein
MLEVCFPTWKPTKKTIAWSFRLEASLFGILTHYNNLILLEKSLQCKSLYKGTFSCPFAEVSGCAVVGSPVTIYEHLEIHENEYKVCPAYSA